MDRNSARSPLTWLHLSDWHQGHRGTLDRKVVLKALLDDIERRATECHPALEKLDFIVFSGDLAFRGAALEFEQARQDFLEPLLQATGVPKDRLILVPGNHDLDRSRLGFLPDLIQKFDNRQSVAEAFHDVAVRSHLLFPMRTYGDFVREFWEDPKDEPEYGFLKTFDCRGGMRVSVLGLNSAWMCGQCRDPYTKEVNDYGRLILGEHQYRERLASDKQADLRLAVLHHPFHWLSDIEQRAATERDLLNHCHFILRGHEHKSAVSVPVGTAGNCAVISAGAAYDRRDYPNGYNFVLLNPDRGQGTIFLRRYVDDRRKFAKDSDTTGDDSPGLVTFTLPKELANTPERDLRTEPSKGRIVGNPWSVQSPSMMQAMGEIFARQHEENPVHYSLARLMVLANSLADETQPDEIVTVVEIEAGEKPVYCHRISFFSAQGSEYLGRASWAVRSLDGEPLEAIEVPIVSPLASNFRQMLLFFDPVLEPGKGRYEIRLAELVIDAMKPLRKRGRDEFFMRAGRNGRTARVELLLLAPSKSGPLQIRKSSRRDPDAALGAPMDPDEARQLATDAGFNTAEFDVHGWLATDVKERGFVAADVVVLA